MKKTDRRRDGEKKKKKGRRDDEFKGWEQEREIEREKRNRMETEKNIYSIVKNDRESFTKW